MAKFFEDLQAYQDRVDVIRTGFKVQMDDYQEKADLFKEEATTVPRRSGAVGDRPQYSCKQS